MKTIILSDDDSAHLNEALRLYQQHLRRNGYRQLPPQLKQLITAVESNEDGMSIPNTALLLMDIETVAQRLQISKRSTTRLLTSGVLPSVTIGRSRRVHHDDLIAFAEGLRSQ